MREAMRSIGRGATLDQVNARLRAYHAKEITRKNYERNYLIAFGEPADTDPNADLGPVVSVERVTSAPLSASSAPPAPASVPLAAALPSAGPTDPDRLTMFIKFAALVQNIGVKQAREYLVMLEGMRLIG